MNEKECCEECLKCPDYTKHDFCHNKSCACHTPQEKEPWITSQERADLIKSVEKCKPIFERAGKVPTEKEPWEKESLARQLHDWYLEATSQEDTKYNYEAVVPYEDLPEGSKLIDRYIAEKVLSLLASERADWLRSEIEKLDGIGEICGNCNGDGWVSGTEAGHGCDGTDESCAMNCPIPIQTQEGCEVCQGDGKIRHPDVTSIITRYKEELKELEGK